MPQEEIEIRKWSNNIHKKACELFSDSYGKYFNEWLKVKEILINLKRRAIKGSIESFISKFDGFGEAIKKCILEDNPADIVEFIKKGGKIQL